MYTYTALCVYRESFNDEKRRIARRERVHIFLKSLSREFFMLLQTSSCVFKNSRLHSSRLATTQNMENATPRDDQYLTDLLSYSVDRLGKVRFFSFVASFVFFFFLFFFFFFLRALKRASLRLEFARADTDISIIEPFLFTRAYFNRNRNDCKQNSRARRRSNTTPR